MSPRMVSPHGDVLDVPDADVDRYLTEGFKPQTDAEAFGAAYESGVAKSYDDPLSAGVAGLARGATFGLSDVAADILGSGDELAKLRQYNPIASTVGEVVGGVAPALIPGSSALGAIARATPAGKVAGIGAKILESGRAGGALKAIGGAAKAGAFEGAFQGGGQYVTEVALEDKPLSAEAFVGAMGKGALFGGAIGGGLAVGEQAFLRAKKLFPKQEVTKQAAEATERQAASELQSSVRDADEMQRAARDRLRAIRMEKAETDLATKAELDRIRIAKEQEKLAREQIRTERVKNPPKRTRRAMGEGEPSTPVATATPAAAPEAGPFNARPGATPPSDLESALAGTKARIDAGESLGDISRGADVEDALDDVVAKVDPEAQGLVAASRKERMTRQEMDDWMARMRGHKERAAKERGSTSSYEESMTGAPASGISPRKLDRVETPLAESAADEAARLGAYRDKELARPTLGESIAAGTPIGGRTPTADEILEVSNLQKAERAAMAEDIDQRIADLLRTKPDDITEDLAEAAQVIGRHEEAAAELAEALGPAAPPSAKARAAGYREAAGAQEAKVGAAAAGLADDVAKAGAQDIAQAAAKGTPSALGKAADLGSALEILQLMGVSGLPSAEDIPVIGPVLGLYLKARAAAAVFRRMGGKVPLTAETTIAARAASTRTRMAGAVQKMLDVGATATRRATPAAGGVGGILSHKLFDDGEPGQRRRKSKSDDIQQLVDERLDEIARAQRPGAVRDAIRKRLRPSDPDLENEIVAAKERKLAYYGKVAPRPTQLPTMLKGDGEWKVSKAQAASFARTIEAGEDPAGVLERLADSGDVSYEGAAVLREVYPALYREAQMTLLERSADLQAKLPYTRRIALSIMFQVPVDGTMEPKFLAFLRSAAPGSATAQQPPAQGSPAPTPTVAGSVRASDRAQTSLDRRAGV